MACRQRFKTLLLVVIAVLHGVAFAAEEHVAAATFSAERPGDTLPAGWTPLSASGSIPRTRYALVDDHGTTVVRAESKAAASGLLKQLRLSSQEFPWLRWRWKIDNLISNADLRTRQGDDFPARLYVMFDYPLEKLSFIERNKLRLARALFDPDLPAATLCYVWDGKAVVETIVPSAYSDRVRLIVVASGAERLGRWVDFERNVAADFRAAFGEAAPPIRAIAIATDTDNTGADATTHFGDIYFYKQRLANIPPVKATAP